MTTRTAADLYHESTEFQFSVPEIPLGPWTSYSLMFDPKHIAFVLARYKFAARMLQGRRSVMEVGCGDGFGLPLVAQAVGHLHCVDWDQRLLDGNARRLRHLGNVTYLKADVNRETPGIKVDAAYWIDVLEHLDAAAESTVLGNIIHCLPDDGVLLTGTPNKAASQYASPHSERAHINLKTMEELRTLMQRHFHNVFLFGMNDEVLHTGYAPMCHYLWSLAVGVRREARAER
jgi:2-polyprenyl-3-methyl-5-hydroxy-6-metoxy-1,4-benzoquinol methylase